MIPPIRPGTPQPSRRASEPEPGPVQAGGGIALNPQGNLSVRKDVLGFIPVQVELKVADVLAGEHGRDFRVDFTDAGHATVSGQAKYGIVTTDVCEKVAIPSGGLVKSLAVHVADDKKLQIQGELDLFGWKIPLRSDVAPRQTAESTFNFQIERLQLGSFNVPRPLATWGASIAAAVIGGFRGVWASGKELCIDFALLARSEKNDRPPAPAA
ncbi:MAG TPA: hypothetical protein V6D00_02790 [Pantanalinema sp.]